MSLLGLCVVCMCCIAFVYSLVCMLVDFVGVMLSEVLCMLVCTFGCSSGTCWQLCLLGLLCGAYLYKDVLVWGSLLD